ncbi:hypothetical protein QN277_015213 [Acacia crassicarpa]|uniref:Uncharacterized protein n=1 Tax=Acacia crassicarpa TaxID=499986 RepID=A0AAE1MR02_9FABA|nr:hypothetical protein QN277_015213 [Acacia crassicarpa]
MDIDIEKILGSLIEICLPERRERERRSGEKEEGNLSGRFRLGLDPRGDPEQDIVVFRPRENVPVKILAISMDVKESNGLSNNGSGDGDIKDRGVGGLGDVGFGIGGGGEENGEGKAKEQEAEEREGVGRRGHGWD